MRFLWVLLLLAGCVATGEVQYDTQGRLYPEQCRGDLSWVNAKIEHRPLSEMPEARGYPGEKTAGGGYLNRTPPLIILANEIPADEMDDAIRHERCHIIAGAWHSYPDASDR